MITFLTLESLFTVVTPSSVKTSDGVFFEGRTSLKGVLSDMGFRYDEMINDRRFTLHQFVCFSFYNTIHAGYIMSSLTLPIGIINI